MSEIVGPMDEKSVKKCPGWLPIVLGVLVAVSIILGAVYKTSKVSEWVTTQWGAVFSSTSGAPVERTDGMMIITAPQRAPILTRETIDGKYYHIIEQGQMMIGMIFQPGQYQAKGYYQYGGLLIYEIYGIAQKPFDGSPEYWLLVFVYDPNTDHWDLVDVYREMTLNQLQGIEE